MNEKISVIVPVYNVQDYLNACIDSIVKQTYSNIEVILVDDGSTDESPKLCDQWAEKDPRIRVIHKKNGGLSDARNVALDLCASEWITFVDSDDWIHHQALEKMLKAAQLECAKMVMASYQRVTDGEAAAEEKIEALSYEVITSVDALKLLYTGKVHQTVAWAKLYHKSLWEPYRFPFGKKNEDEFTTYKLMYDAGKIVNAIDEIYFYRMRPGSIMADPERKMNFEIFEALWERQDFFEKHQLDELAVINVNFILDRLMERAAALKENQKTGCMADDFRKVRQYIKVITPRNRIKWMIFSIYPKFYGKLVQLWKNHYQ